MSFSSQSLIALAVCPLLVGVLLQLLLAKILPSKLKGMLAVLCCFPSLVAVIASFIQVHGGGPLDFNAFGWDGPLSLVFHVDSLSLMFAFMGTGLGLFVLLYSIDYMANDKSATRFYVFMLTFICGMVGLVFSSNLFFFYLCWEAMGLCSFSLVGFWYKDPQAVAGARKVLLMTHLAGYGLLAAILMIYSRTGSALWTDPGVAKAFSGGVFALMLIAIVAKSVQFPLHTWIPEAMAAPTPVSALLHAACYVKAGVYLSARMYSFGHWQPSWGAAMMWVGTVTMVVGVLYAMVQTDLKRMLAFHTVSQIGYMITGIGLGTPLGIAAALLHCLNHSFFKGGLFLAAGAVQHSTGTRDMNLLGGLSKRMPKTTIVWLISVGSMMGVPLMSGFASKWMLYTAALQSGQVVPALAAWVVSIGTVFSCVKATSAVFLGRTNERTEKAHEAAPSMVWGLGLFGLGSIVLGVAPQIAVRYVINPILPALGMANVQVSWFGLSNSAGSWWAMGGLVLAVFSAAAGAVVYAMAGVSRSRALATGGNVVLAGAGAGGGTVGVFTGGESMVGTGRLPASEFSAILKRYWAPIFHVADVDRYYLNVWEVLQGVARRLHHAVVALEKHGVVCVVGLSAALICAVRWFAPHVVNSASGGVGSGVPFLLAAACGIACVALCLAGLSMRAWRGLVPLMALTGVIAVGALLVSSGSLRLALLEVSALLAVALVARNSSSKRATWAFLAMVLVSALSLVAGQLLLQRGDTEWARALLIGGFFLKLAVVPLFLWLPSLAEKLPALVMGVVISVLDIAAFGELYSVAQSHPWVITPVGLWVGVGMASALLASTLMLVESNLKRLLAFSTIEDIGFLTLGVASANEIGMRGALIAATVHALAKALLFISLSAPEADGALSAKSRGLASRYPLSAAGFLLGMLAMLGIPPTLGFAGRWRLYETALQINPWVLAVFVLSSMFALISYVLCLTRVWWGPPIESDVEGAAHVEFRKEPMLLCATIVVIMMLLLVGGLWPDAIAIVIRGIR